MKRIIIILMCLMIFVLRCFAQEEYSVTKESFNELNQIWLEAGSYAGDLLNIAKESKVEEQKEKFYLMFINFNMIYHALSEISSMLLIEFDHAEENQFSSNAIAYIWGGISGLIDITDRNIRSNNEALSNCDDDLLVNQYKETNEHLFRIKKVLEKIEKELNIPKENLEGYKQFWDKIAH